MTNAIGPDEMDFADLLKDQGNWALGWIAFFALLKWVLSRFDKMVEAMVQSATAMNALADMIENWVSRGKRD